MRKTQILIKYISTIISFWGRTFPTKTQALNNKIFRVGLEFSFGLAIVHKRHSVLLIRGHISRRKKVSSSTGDKNCVNTDLTTHVSVPAFAMMSSTLIGWYRGCADSTRFDTVSSLIATGGFCARVASWKGLGWGPAEVDLHGACVSGFKPEGNNKLFSRYAELTSFNVLCKRCIPPPTHYHYFIMSLRGVLLIKNFSWRRINYKAKS